ncbi:alpha-L-rhamnosidase-related protein [Prauserella endophytica]|uniref:alpha-L-rhamnosidase-related protein n=1 Tax=Prauserella endophytica TaxID=1592324 RepID=UPI00197CD8DE|nr:alpha-L-rhamnosidase C-terminal domain-containing protein [Prauserella endophytica]
MFGLVPPGTEASVVASLPVDIRARGDHLNTGVLGTSVLLRVLSGHGHADVAHAIATQLAVTPRERGRLAARRRGSRAVHGSAGRTRVPWTRTSLETVRGEVSAGWARLDGELRLTVVLPVGVTAGAHVPPAARDDVHAPRGPGSRGQNPALRCTPPGMASGRSRAGTLDTRERTPQACSASLKRFSGLGQGERRGDCQRRRCAEQR